MRYNLFLTCFTLLLIIPASAIKRYSLEEIKANPKFEVTIMANGAYSGESIELKIKSNFKKNVEVLIPAGTVFYTPEEEEQILILVEEQLLVLSKGKTRKKVLDGFCTEAKDGVPGDELGMAFMPTKRDQLQKLANFINENSGFDDHAIQEAVWCVSDKYPVSNIYSADRAKAKQLAQFVADLTGQELSWHWVKRSHSVVGNHIRTSPVHVSGKITFSTTKPSTLKSKVLDSSGEVIAERQLSTTIPKANDIGMDFEMSVTGWEKGSYRVIYEDQDGKVLVDKAFEI
jgi:hypothetical protein